MMVEALAAKSVEPIRWLVIAGIAYTLATTIWTFFDTAPIDTQALVERPTAPARTRPAANINWVLSKNLFGEVDAEAQAVVDTGPVTETRLPLELKGVFVADVNEESTAIVAQKGKTGRLYTVGAKLPGNATLVSVHNKHIILRRAGARESLPFPKAKNGMAIETQLPEPEDDLAQLDEVVDELLEEELAGDGEELSPDDLLETYQERLANDASGTLNELGIEQAEGGGYRIGNIAQSPYLRQTGLQSGDVILSVNGREVGDIQQDRLELQELVTQGSARIEVQRGSRRFFITASLK